MIQPAKSHNSSRIHISDIHLATRIGLGSNTPSLPRRMPPKENNISLPTSRSLDIAKTNTTKASDRARINVFHSPARSSTQVSCPWPELAADPRSERGRPTAHSPALPSLCRREERGVGRLARRRAYVRLLGEPMQAVTAGQTERIDTDLPMG